MNERRHVLKVIGGSVMALGVGCGGSPNTGAGGSGTTASGAGGAVGAGGAPGTGGGAITSSGSADATTSSSAESSSGTAASSNSAVSSGGTTTSSASSSSSSSTAASSSSSTAASSSSGTTTSSSSGGGCTPPAVGVQVGRPSDFVGNGLHYTPPDAMVLIGRDAGGLYALTAICTHLSCDLNGEGTLIMKGGQNAGIMCDCHNSQFNTTGGVTHGPATRPLNALKLWLDCDGFLYVDTATVVSKTTRLMA